MHRRCVFLKRQADEINAKLSGAKLIYINSSDHALGNQRLINGHGQLVPIKAGEGQLFIGRLEISRIRELSRPLAPINRRSGLLRPRKRVDNTREGS